MSGKVCQGKGLKTCPAIKGLRQNTVSEGKKTKTCLKVLPGLKGLRLVAHGLSFLLFLSSEGTPRFKVKGVETRSGHDKLHKKIV